VSETEPTPNAGKLSALRDLVASEGWKLFTAHAEEQWSDEAFGLAVDQVMSANAPTDVEWEKVRRMRDERKRILGLLRWPYEQIGTLTPSKPAGAFAALRRIAR
jgi:hypothetical protein